MTSNSMYAFIKKGLNNPKQTKIWYEGREISAGKMLDDIDRVATFLVEKGIEQGDKVAICLPNIPQAIISLYAVNKIGAVANVLHPKITGKALINALKNTETKLIFLFAQNLRKNRKELENNNIMVVNCKVADYFKGYKKIYKLFEYNYISELVIPYKKTLKNISENEFISDGKDDAVLLHSSGTFGKSKIVKLSSLAFNNLVNNILEMVEKRYEVKDSDSMLMILPIFHGFGLGVCVHLPVFKCKTVLMPKFSAKGVAKLIKRYPINMVAGVPSMFNKLAREIKFDNKNLQNMKLLFCGGDKLDNDTKEKIDKLLEKNNSKAKLMEGYGLSEVASVVTINIEGKNNNSQGIAIPNVDIKIIDEKNNVLPVDKIGEICICSQSVMNGYYDDAKIENAQINGKNYIKTGDFGCVDNENYLYYKDRKKRIILIGGINIYPQEIESLIRDLDEVNNCAVIRICSPKPHTKVYLELKNNISFDKNLKNKIIELVKNNIISYAVPKEFEVVEKIKLNAIGKVDFNYYENIDNKIMGEN